MSSSIFDDKNEEYLRKIIDADENLKNDASASLEKIIASKLQTEKDIRELEGSKSIPVSILPSRGLFYPEDLVITVSPLKVKQIRHFSTIDETDEIDVTTKLNFIVNSSIKVQTKAKGFSSISLLDIDRLYLLFIVREITFVEFPSIMKIESTCNECETTEMVDIKAERLGAVKQGSLEDYLSTYSKQDRCINFTIGQELLKFYLPSMENLEVARKEIIDNNLTEEEHDRFMLCFLTPPGIKLSNLDFLKFEQEMEEWSPDKYMAVRSFVSAVNSSYSIDVYYKCSSCGAGVAAPLRFHRGIKELFVPQLSDRPD
jgi:hypothetical protein